MAFVVTANCIVCKDLTGTQAPASGSVAEERIATSSAENPDADPPHLPDDAGQSGQPPA